MQCMAVSFLVVSVNIVYERIKVVHNHPPHSVTFNLEYTPPVAMHGGNCLSLLILEHNSCLALAD